MSEAYFYNPTELRAFVRESNRIEAILRPPTKGEIAAHETILALERIELDNVRAFVRAVAKKEIRDQPGMNVRVGSYIAPAGGPNIPTQLTELLVDMAIGINPYVCHQRYEALHPFMDGNGRSGRALWLWQMLRESRATQALQLGFLHTWYYQSLSAARPQ